MFDTYGHFIPRGIGVEVEFGPLRPSGLSLDERRRFGLPWLCLEHPAVPYVTRCDLRAVSGRIIRQGTFCSAARGTASAGSGLLQGASVLDLTFESGELVRLSGLDYILAVEDLPRRTLNENDLSLLLPA